MSREFHYVVTYRLLIYVLKKVTSRPRLGLIW